MSFNESDWIERVKIAQDGEALRALLQELPLDDTCLTNKEGQGSFSTEPVMTLPAST